MDLRLSLSLLGQAKVPARNRDQLTETPINAADTPDADQSKPSHKWTSEDIQDLSHLLNGLRVDDPN